MAANDNAVSQPDGDAAAPVAPPEKQRGGRLGLLIVTVVILAALGSGAAVAFSQYDRIAQAAAMFAASTPADTTAAEQEPPEFGTFYQIENMIVNPADTDGRRYLMISVGFEAKEEAVSEELEQKEVVIRDLMLRHLGKRTVPELSDVDVRPTIKGELRDSVNTLLVGRIDRLYFTQFVLQ